MSVQEKEDVIKILALENDLNMRSLFEKCITSGYTMSLMVVFDKFMESHGTITCIEDQRLLIAVQ